MRTLIFIAISMILTGHVATAVAQDERAGTYIRMEETEIIGVVEHPEITYIIPKTRVRFNQIPLEKDFTSEATRWSDLLTIEEETNARALLTTP